MTLSIRSVDASLWLDLVRMRLRRFDSVRIDDQQSIVWMPRVGSIVFTDTGTALILQTVAPDDFTLAFIMDALSFELAAAVPAIDEGHQIALEWTYPRVIPVPLRS